MKIIIAALALAAMAFAAPADGFQKRQACAPATYSCTSDFTGAGCDVSGVWDVSKLLPRGLGPMLTLLQQQFAGSCPPGTGCVFYPPSLSPYCVPPGFVIPS